MNLTPMVYRRPSTSKRPALYCVELPVNAENVPSTGGLLSVRLVTAPKISAVELPMPNS